MSVCTEHTCAEVRHRSRKNSVKLWRRILHGAHMCKGAKEEAVLSFDGECLHAAHVSVRRQQVQTEGAVPTLGGKSLHGEA